LEHRVPAGEEELPPADELLVVAESLDAVPAEPRRRPETRLRRGVHPPVGVLPRRLVRDVQVGTVQRDAGEGGALPVRSRPVRPDGLAVWVAGVLLGLLLIARVAAQPTPVVPYPRDYKSGLVKYAVVDRSDGLSRDLY